MKRLIPGLAAMVLLCGCSFGEQAQEEALELRSRALSANAVTFRAEIAADYIDHVEEFTLECAFDADGVLSFTVAEPEQICGIAGTVSGTEGALTFDDQILAFPLMAEERLSPVSAPWIVMKALRSGCIIACAREEEVLHVTVDDSYADDALTVDLWADENGIVAAEVSWQGRRAVAMEIENCIFMSDGA